MSACRLPVSSRHLDGRSRRGLINCHFHADFWLIAFLNACQPSMSVRCEPGRAPICAFSRVMCSLSQSVHDEDAHYTLRLVSNFRTLRSLCTQWIKRNSMAGKKSWLDANCVMIDVTERAIDRFSVVFTFGRQVAAKFAVRMLRSRLPFENALPDGNRDRLRWGTESGELAKSPPN